MNQIEAKAEKTERALREVTRLAAEVDSSKRKVRDFDSELQELRTEIGGITSKVALRVEASMDVPGLEQRLEGKIGTQDSKLQELQASFQESARSERTRVSAAQEETARLWQQKLDQAAANVQPVAAGLVKAALDERFVTVDELHAVALGKIQALATGSSDLKELMTSSLARLDEEVRQPFNTGRVPLGRSGINQIAGGKRPTGLGHLGCIKGYTIPYTILYCIIPLWVELRGYRCSWRPAKPAATRCWTPWRRVPRWRGNRSTSSTWGRGDACARNPSL
jgi:hypothetical protein